MEHEVSHVECVLFEGSRAETEIQQVLEELAEAGVERAWVTAKHPFLLFVFPAILPLTLFGDPIVWILGISNQIGYHALILSAAITLDDFINHRKGLMANDADGLPPKAISYRQQVYKDLSSTMLSMPYLS